MIFSKKTIWIYNVVAYFIAAWCISLSFEVVLLFVCDIVLRIFHKLWLQSSHNVVASLLRLKLKNAFFQFSNIGPLFWYFNKKKWLKMSLALNLLKLCILVLATIENIASLDNSKGNFWAKNGYSGSVGNILYFFGRA